MAVARKQYNTVRKLWMVGRTKCQAQLPVCTVIASQVHHMEGRDTIERLLDTNKWMAVCPPCHRWITDHSKEAIAMGLSMRRNGHLPPVEKSG